MDVKQFLMVFFGFMSVISFFCTFTIAVTRSDDGKPVSYANMLVFVGFVFCLLMFSIGASLK